MFRIFGRREDILSLRSKTDLAISLVKSKTYLKLYRLFYFFLNISLKTGERDFFSETKSFNGYKLYLSHTISK